jgi:RHS repeat-associated protein
VQRLKTASYYDDPDVPDITGPERTSSYGFRMFSLLVEQYLRDHPNVAKTLAMSYAVAPRIPGALICKLHQKEVHLYGNSRLGIDKASRDTLYKSSSGAYQFIRNPFSGSMIIYRTLAETLLTDASAYTLPVPSARGRALGDTIGQKRYELSNHLGNVLAVVSDKRIVVGCTTYAAELHQATDYYPFGAPMPGRSLSLERNEAARLRYRLIPSAPQFFKQQRYYTIDGRKTLYLYYPHVAAAPGTSFSYAFECTTSVSPLNVERYSMVSTADNGGVRLFAAYINRKPDRVNPLARASVSLELVNGVYYDVIAVTFGPALADVPYGRISFLGASAGIPLHVFVDPGADDDDYRYGFNGKENDSETNSIDFGNRCYDPRVGRWFSEDPKKHWYPQMSPSTGMGNSPLVIIDPDGGDIIILNATKAVGGKGHAAVLIGNNRPLS